MDENDKSKVKVLDLLRSLDTTQPENHFEDASNSFVGNDELSMRSHNESYTKILAGYSNTLEENLTAKCDYKKWFFWCCIGILFSVAMTLIGSVWVIIQMTYQYQHLTFAIQNVISTVSAISVAFIASFMIIPKIITNYLFNLNEEKNMMEIIQNIQKHDLAIRKDIKEYKNGNNTK